VADCWYGCGACCLVGAPHLRPRGSGGLEVSRSSGLRALPLASRGVAPTVPSRTQAHVRRCRVLGAERRLPRGAGTGRRRGVHRPRREAGAGQRAQARRAQEQREG
jgi:hypothetical protein